jgi:hypothetical protein
MSEQFAPFRYELQRLAKELVAPKRLGTLGVN